MTVFLTKDFFARANKGHDGRTGTTTVTAPARKSLSGLVLAAVQAVPERDLIRVAALNAGIAYQPRSLLALISYCYAREIYASQDIEGVMRRDASFRILCDNEFPDWRLVRRFGRRNREAIQFCLAATLRQEQAAMEGNGSAGSLVVRRQSAWSAEDCLEQEAARRIEKAMHMDLMADDCDEW